MWGTFDRCREKLALQYKQDNWDTSDGLPIAELKAQVEAVFAQPGKSRMVRKAEALSLILEKAQVEILPDDFFADKLNFGRIMLDEMDALCLSEEKAARNAQQEALHACCGLHTGMDHGHLAPDWDFLMAEGIPGVIVRLKACRRQDRAEYYDCCIAVYESMIRALERMAAAARRIGTEKTLFTAENLEALACHAPRTLAQAMQLTLFIYNIQTNGDTAYVRSLGGLDRLYHPFYAADIAAGRFTDGQLRELTRDFLCKLGAREVFANIPFYICGKLPDGRDAANAFTYLLLEEYRRLDIYDPKFHVFYHEGMDPGVLRLVMEMIREGKNSFVLMNTGLIEEALMGIGIAEADAKRPTVYGCYEPAAEGTELPATCGGKVNLAKAAELTIHNGVDPLTGERAGLALGEDFDSFEGFYEGVKKQLLYMTQQCMDTLKAYESRYEDVFAFPVFSPTFASSVRSGRDVLLGGAKYNNTSVVGTGLATLADSVAAVKKAVYEEKRITLPELRRVLQNNWEGAEALLLRCRSRYPKFGNNDAEADAITAELYELFASAVNGRPNGRGGVFRCAMFSVDWRMWMGKATGATPDGRRSGEPLSKNLCASTGRDKAGVTALVHSLLKLKGRSMPGGGVADIVLHTSAVKGEEGMDAFMGLLKAFMQGGGFAVHFNVLDPRVLLQAQAEPEKYRNLQIRLCGWNVYFVDLSKQEQDEFIAQSLQ